MARPNPLRPGPIRPGEVRFGVQEHPSLLRRGWRLFLRGWHALPHSVQQFIVLFSPFIVFFPIFWIWWLFTPTHVVHIPAIPNPPGYYAVVATSRPSTTHPGEVDVAYAGFVGERIQFVTVKSVEDIPASVRASASVVEPGSGTRVPDDASIFKVAKLAALIRVLSHFTVQDRVNVRATDDLHPLAYGTQQLKPYILHGDVDVRCGDLAQNDSGMAKMFVQESSLKAASFDLKAGLARGPPNAVRTVYVVGEVRSVEGPEQFGNSRFTAEVLDLGAKAIEVATFEAAMNVWRQNLSTMAQNYDVPEENLWSREGSTFQKKGAQVSGVNARGETEPILTNEQVRSQASEAAESSSGKSKGWWEEFESVPEVEP